MIKILKLINFYLIIALVCASQFDPLFQKSPQQIYQASWLNYNKQKQKFSLFNPISKLEIQFPFKQSQIETKEITLSRNSNNEQQWRLKFQNENSQTQIKVLTKGKVGLFQIKLSQAKVFRFRIGTFRDLEKHLKNIYFAKQSLQSNSLKPLNQECTFQNQSRLSVICQLTDISHLYILVEKSDNSKVNPQIFQQNAFDQQSKKVLDQFMGSYRINTESNLTTQLVKDMLTFTLSSICIQNSQYQGQTFYGLCSNNKRNKIQRHYSLMVIQILFRFNIDLAMWLTQNYLNLLEQKLFYSFREQQWIPIPEHIQVFQTYLKHLYKSSKFTQSQNLQRKNRVIQVQQGLLNTLLLLQVNHLSQQINYRQTKQIHPTIMKMLTQCWQSSSPRAKVSSIYDQSFTYDFYYHSKNEKLESSVGKMMWLLKLLYQHIRTVKNYGDNMQKEQLQQLMSLSKVIHGFILDQPRAKQGAFNSIIVQQKIKVYSRSIGYESLLPFAYDISPLFPINPIFNLTNNFGLTSLPENHEKASQAYDFRGNINLYFNYKLLITLLQKTLETPKNHVYNSGLKLITESFQKRIIQIYEFGLKQNNDKFYTSWTSKGKGVKSENYLAIINAAFLTKLDFNSKSSNVQNGKQEKKQNIEGNEKTS